MPTVVVDWPTINVDNLSGVVVLATIAVLVITDKLVWHTRLKREIARADKWQDIAIEALTTGAHSGVRASEVAADIIAALPDPSRGKE